MAVVVKTVRYVSINTTYTAKNDYYLIKFVSETYTIHEETMCNGKICTSGEIFFKAQYMNCMQDNTKWYWERKKTEQYNCSHTHNCTSMLGCHHHLLSRKTPKSV